MALANGKRQDSVDTVHTVGELLRQWRQRRRLSQLELALAAEGWKLVLESFVHVATKRVVAQLTASAIR
jgi:hypothetical protein